jgi:hypothetical protein
MKQTKANMTTRLHCRDDIVLNITKGVSWRKTQAQRWPDDTRNAAAADALSDLALQSTDLDDDVWERLEPHFHPTNQHWRDAVSAATREVGFRTWPDSFADFVENVLDRVTV